MAAWIMGLLAARDASRWTVEGLEYDRVLFYDRTRSAPSIHLVREGGERYRITRRLWREWGDGRDLASLLRSDSLVTVDLVGGDPRWLHGYPVVERLETRGLTLSRARRNGFERWTLPGLGGVLVVFGAWLALSRTRSCGCSSSRGSRAARSSRETG